MGKRLPLPALLSAALVAFTIEADNEAEHQLPHKTTSYGNSGGRGSVWMTSLAMWFNCLRGLDENGPLTVSELERQARMGTNLDGMRRWGYVTIDGVGRVERGEQRPRPKAGSVLALTERGRMAAGVWQSLPAEIEARWNKRFGAAAVDRMRVALIEIVLRSEPALPDFMPIGSVHGVGLDDAARAGDQALRDAEGPADLPLISLLSRALLAFALDYERGAKLSLATQCNGVRVLSAGGVPLRDLPALTGVSKEAVNMILTQLQRVGCAEIVPLPGVARGKLARLTTDRGLRAATAAPRRLERTLDGWRDRYGDTAVTSLRAALEPIAGNGTRTGSPLFAGLTPYPDGWRAEAPQPQLLPWFPMVLHRGGYPDGS